MTHRRCMAAFVATYLAAGLTTALALEEIHYQRCAPVEWNYKLHITSVAIWPIVGVVMFVADRAESYCSPEAPVFGGDA